jgi:hypothetical protein
MSHSLNLWRAQVRLVELLPSATSKARETILSRLTTDSRRWSCQSSADFDAIADMRLETLCREVSEGSPTGSIAERNAGIRSRNQQRKAHYYPFLPPKESLEDEIPEPVSARVITAPPARQKYSPIDIDPKHRVLMDRAIDIGIRKILPAKLRHKKYLGTYYLGKDSVTEEKMYEDRYAETQIPDDIRSKVWTKLLEPECGLYKDGKPNTKDAYNWARRLSTDWLREELPTLPVSQMDLPKPDPDSDDGQDSVEPWDRVDLSKPAQFEESVFRIVRASEDKERAAALAALKDKSPDDHKFIVEYVEGTRVNKPYSLLDRQRALNIRRWLGRRAPVRKIN